MFKPSFVKAYQNVEEENAKKLPRPLPEGYLWQIIVQEDIPESIRALALPFLASPLSHDSTLWKLLSRAQTTLLTNGRVDGIAPF